MIRRNLYVLAYVLFLLMFATTFVVAVGAILKIAPFDRIDPAYTDHLFWILVCEIAVIGVDLFRRMPRPYPSTIPRYKVKVAYRNFSEDLKNALNEEQKKIWNSYLKGEIGPKPTRKEQAVIAEIKTAEINDGQQGSGEIYLNFDSGRHWLEGSLNYQFPHDRYFTHMPVVGKLSKNDMQLELSQPERFFWDEDEVRVRPAVNYNLHLTRDKGDNKILTGALVYPQPSSRIEAAKVTFIEED